MPNQIYAQARTFVYRNARPLDIARWQYHFEEGSREAVLAALSVYQNEDGGFGHALEPDIWNPNSSPIQTWVATEILQEIDFSDAKHPIMRGLLHYLSSGQDFTGYFWNNTVQSNNNYPHAPWWHSDSNSSCHNDYNPTASLAGFLLHAADKGSESYLLGHRIAKEAITAYMCNGLLSNMHTAACYIRLIQYCEEAEAKDVGDISSFKTKLREQIKHSITRDRTAWKNGYICKPSQFFSSCNSTFYPDNKEMAEFECDYIVNSQLADGSWNIPWGWNDYPEQWSISKNWWKANGAILNLLYLKGMKKLKIE